MKKKDPNKYPKGLNAKKVQAIIDRYDSISDSDLAFEIENVPEVKPPTFIKNAVWMQIPQKLVPQVKQLLARRRKSA